MSISTVAAAQQWCSRTDPMRTPQFLVWNGCNLANLIKIHNMEISTDTVSVVINGLIKKPLVAPLDLTTTYEERFELPKDAQLMDLWVKLDCTLQYIYF